MNSNVKTTLLYLVPSLLIMGSAMVGMMLPQEHWRVPAAIVMALLASVTAILMNKWSKPEELASSSSNRQELSNRVEPVESVRLNDDPTITLLGLPKSGKSSLLKRSGMQLQQMASGDVWEGEGVRIEELNVHPDNAYPKVKSLSGGTNLSVVVWPVEALGTYDLNQCFSQMAEQVSLRSGTGSSSSLCCLVLSKCDALSGFCDLFAACSSELSAQPLGWTNPEPWVKKSEQSFHVGPMDGLVSRLRAVRLTLLQEMAHQRPELDALDRMDAFRVPEVIENEIAPAVAIFLECMRQRGVSVMGVYLSAIPQPVGALRSTTVTGSNFQTASNDSSSTTSTTSSTRMARPSGLFVERLFGKLIRDAAIAHRNARVHARPGPTLWPAGVICSGLLMIYLAWSWRESNDLKRELGKEIPVWLLATHGWQNNAWYPLVSSSDRVGASYEYPGRFAYQGDRLVGGGLSMSAFHDVLYRLADKSLASTMRLVPGRILASRDTHKRREVQRLLVEKSIIQPLFIATQTRKERLGVPNIRHSAEVEGRNSKDRYDRAMNVVNIIRTDATRDMHRHFDHAGEVREVLEPLLQYVTDTDLVLDESICRAVASAYGSSRNKSGLWPPSWLADTIEKIK